MAGATHGVLRPGLLYCCDGCGCLYGDILIDTMIMLLVTKALQENWRLKCFFM